MWESWQDRGWPEALTHILIRVKATSLSHWCNEMFSFRNECTTVQVEWNWQTKLALLSMRKSFPLDITIRILKIYSHCLAVQIILDQKCWLTSHKYETLWWEEKKTEDCGFMDEIKLHFCLTLRNFSKNFSYQKL